MIFASLRPRRLAWAGAVSAAVLAAPAAAQLDLNLNSVVDVSALNLKAMGGAAFDDATGHLWLTDACGPGCPSPGSNMVWELDPLTGSPFSSFDAGVIPGLDVGADGLALDFATGNLFLFSPYLEDEGGVVTQLGVLVTDFPSALGAPAAAVSPAGELYIVSDSQAGGDDALHRVNMVTGVIETTVPFVGYLGRVPSMDFDPITGNLFIYAESGTALLEFDITTGQLFSITDMNPFGFAGKHFATAFAFNADGSQLYFGKGEDTDADSLYVFDRNLTPPCAKVFCVEMNFADLDIDTCDCSAGSMNLILTNATPNELGYPLVSAFNGVVSNPPGTQGDLCLIGGKIGRYVNDIMATDAQGSAQCDVLNALTAGGNGAVPTIGGELCNPPGQTWYFQWWYHDGPGSSRFSKAIEVTF